MKKSNRAVVAAALVVASVLAAGCGGRSEPVAGPAVGSSVRAQIYFPEIMIFNDHARFKHLGVNTEVHSGTLFNLATGYFTNSTAFSSSFITLLLVKQVTFMDKDPFEIPLDSNNQVDSEKLLNNFTNYITTLPAEERKFDGAILLSGRTFKGAELGLAWIGGICAETINFGVAQANLYTNDPFDAAVVAHSIGHLLGFCHDPPAQRDSSYCTTSLITPNPDSACASRIMAANYDPSNPPSTFSECSNEDFKNSIVTRQPACLNVLGSVKRNGAW
jgi:hypothetical protein